MYHYQIRKNNVVSTISLIFFTYNILPALGTHWDLTAMLDDPSTDQIHAQLRVAGREARYVLAPSQRPVINGLTACWSQKGQETVPTRNRNWSDSEMPSPMKYEEGAHLVKNVIHSTHAIPLTVRPIQRLIHSHWIKWSSFRKRYFQYRFLRWKLFYFDSNLSDVCS